MAGGTFNLSSPKVRPGAYANTKNGKQPTTATVPSGIAIIPLIGYDWGPRGEMIHLTNESPGCREDKIRTFYLRRQRIYADASAHVPECY